MKKTLALFGALMMLCGTGYQAQAAPAPQVTASSSATSIVTGRVVDEQGEPVIGASIVEVGTTRGTSTDVDGNFSLRAGTNAKLQISFIGYKTVTTRATAGMNIVLAEDKALLDELVVVGYGTQKKVNLTGAVSTVDVDKTFNSRPEQDVSRALQGAVPGLSIINASGDIDGNPTIRIRGVGTLSNDQTSAPMIVIDGVVSDMDGLQLLNGNDIASVSVLKDAASSSIYGTRAAFGVILITTKAGQKGERATVSYSNNFGWDNPTYLPDFPDVPTQLNAAIMAKKREGSDAVELFGMYFDQLLPYAEAWKQQNGGKKIGYGEMRPYVSDSNVGDYRFIGSQPMYYADYDIQNIWYNHAAPSQGHNVSVRGASNRTTYYMSFGYNYKEDNMKWNPAMRKRYNAAANIQTDLTDWWTVGTRINFSRRHFSRADTWNNMYQYIWRWGSFFIPSGTIADPTTGEQLDFRVVAMQKQAARKNVTMDRLSMTAFTTMHITKDLTLNADFTYEIGNMNSGSSDHTVYGYNWSGVTPQWIVNSGNTNAWRDNSKSNKWAANATLNWNKSFNDAHNFNIMVGVNGDNYSSDYFYAYRPQLYSESYPEMALTYGDQTKWNINSSTFDKATAGYFGRINYDYKGIYLLELNGRYDGSSSFPVNDHWAFFPSGSVGYRFTQEKYWDRLRHIVDNGKLRFSYGTIGNEAVGENMFQSLISPIAQGNIYWLNESNAKVTELGLPSWVNSSLTWERITTMDAGIDLGLFGDVLTMGFDWYQRTTSDMLGPGTALPPSVGAAAPVTNNGELRTRGWEATLDLRKQFNKDFGAYFSASIGDAKTKVTKWNNESHLIGYPCNSSYAYEGMTWGDIWGFETDRYFTERDFAGKNADGSWIYAPGVADQTGIQTQTFVFGPGDIKYKDLDNNGVIDGGKGTQEDHGDLKVIGNMMPRYEYSFHVGGNFKGFDLDVFFQGVGKREMWTQSAFVFPMMRSADLAIYANQTKYNIYDPENGVVNISEDNDFPCLFPGNEYAGNVVGLSGEGGSHNYYPQTKYLVDMSYLRLKNITLGYTLPENLTRKAFIEKFRLYGSVNNLCLLHKGSGDLPIDPEMNAGQGSLGYGTWGRTYPINRTWSVGLQITFGTTRSAAAAAAPVDNSALNAQINDLRAQLTDAQNSYNARIADLQNQLNAANNRNNQLQKDLAACQNSKSGMIDKAMQYMTVLVHFPINSMAVYADQQPNVERIAAYLKSHPEATCTINGYASKDGPQDRNIQLANGRAANVKDMLVKKYGIDAKRINAQGQGISNMFDELSWNRVSICEIIVK